MAEDWDLHAVVRSCKSASTKNSAINSTTTNTTASENPLACLASLTFEEAENDPFSFPRLLEPRTNAFQELQELWKSFFPTTIATSSRGIINPNSSISDIQRRRHPVRPNTTTSTVRSHFKPGSSSSSSRFGGVQDQQQRRHAHQQPQQQNQPYQHRQQVHQQEFHRPQASSAMSLPAMQSQAPRSRKRKSQQKRTVCHVTAENLSADMWAWRKYGQKPIKGSPYPRNYYRCSSSKGCAARKQVERSNVDPNIFIVTYTGDHSHPRPTHRNSLAGSTRNKCSTSHKSIVKDNSRSPHTTNAASCSSPQSTTSLSLTTPLTVQTDEEAIITNKNSYEEDNKIMVDVNDKEREEIADDADDDDDDDDDDQDEILIPNMAMTEDIFMGLQQLGYSSPGGGSGDNFSDDGRANSGSSWPPCGSAAATTARTAMGGC